MGACRGVSDWPVTAMKAGERKKRKILILRLARSQGKRIEM